MSTRPAPPPGTREPARTETSWLRRTAGRWLGPPADAPAAPSMLDAVPDPVLVVDAADRIQSANRAVETVLGHDPAALVGAELAETLIPLRDRDAYRARLRGLVGPDAELAARLAVFRGDGTEVPADVTVRPAPGQPLFVVSLRDARAAQDAEAALDAAEGRRRTLHTIVDSIPDSVVAVDRAGRVVLRNQAARDLGDAAPHLSAQAQRDAERVVQTGEPVLDREEAQAGGGVQRTSSIPVCDRGGTVVGVVAISRDVTAQRAAEAQLLADKRAAEEAARANREFLATTSHEVRTLMSGVTGMTTLLSGTALDSEQREFVDTIRTSSAALLAVINDVLDFSKMEAGMLALDDHPFEVRPAVEEALRMVAQQGAAKGIDLAWCVDPDVPETVRGDAARVRQVLLNLLSNAVKFTDRGHVRVRVSRAEPAAAASGPAASGAAALSVAVEDTGIGIAADRLDAIFEQFEQADASTARTHGGTGLGLAICRRLVQMMGGEMSAESVPGEGSTFRFTIAERAAGVGRAAAVAEPPAAYAAGDGAMAAPEIAGGVVAEAPPDGPADDDGPGVVMSMDAIIPTARVLLAEDNPVNQRVTVLTLRRLGYRPDVVPDGAKAVFAVRNRPYDVVLMDVMMPVMDGLEATRQIRADPGRHPAPAIVALTANALDGDRKRCLDAGCDDYVAKPVAPEFLAATIERAVREQGQGAE